MTRPWLRVAFLLLLLAIASGCREEHEDHGSHSHAEEHPDGHDHHASGHGHDEPMVWITQWGDGFELFAEHEPVVVNQRVTLLAHLTVLEGFKPLTDADVRLELEGPSPIRLEPSKRLRPGIFELSFVARQPGSYSGRVVIGGKTKGVVDGFSVKVFPDQKTAKASVAPREDGSRIEFLKEQQWGVEFGTSFAEVGTLVESIEVAGHVGTPPGGSAQVGAPVLGRIVAPSSGLPNPGDTVKRGKLLAQLAPAPAAPEESARVSLTLAEAEARLAGSRSELARAERLIRDEAISDRELEQAQREVQVAEEAVRSAKHAQQIFAGARASGSAGAWALKAPISGILTEVRATPGASVSPGDVLFRIVDQKELWVIARVPEQDAARLRADRDAAFRVSGLDTWQKIDVTGEDANARVVTVGRTVDSVKRTVDVIYALTEPREVLRVGGLLRVSLPVGGEFSGVVVPASAVLRDGAREFVYVQADGEHFEQRLVKTAPRAGERIGISSGVEAGERIVVKGANLVRLADRPSGEQPHGHIH